MLIKKNRLEFDITINENGHLGIIEKEIINSLFEE